MILHLLRPRRLLALLALLAIGACGGGGRADVVGRWDHLVGYGPADTWHTLDEQEFARLLWRNGLTLTGIEWVPSGQPRNDCSCRMPDGRCGTLGTYPAKAAAWIASMAARGITTLVTINANECSVQRATDEWYEAQIRAIIEAAGPSAPSVILMPLSEPGELGNRAKARRWTQLARRLWPGAFAVAFGDRDIPHDYIDWHWCDDDDLTAALESGARDWINSTDCPGMFQLDPARARSAALASAVGGTVLYVYADKYLGPHEPIIEALRP